MFLIEYNQPVFGDALELSKQLPDESINCIVTSPPYWGLRDYGHPRQLGLEKTPEEYVNKLVALFRELRRALCSDGTFWLNLGDSYAGTASNGHQGKTGQRANRTFTASTISKISDGLKPKDLVGIPWRVAFALQADGWYLRSDIIWAKPNPMPESVTDRPTKAHEYLFLLAKSERYFFDGKSIRVPYAREYQDGPGFGGFASKETAKYTRAGIHGSGPNAKVRDGRNPRTVWPVATIPYPGAHFATFPPDLIKPCILAGCPQDGIVLDPFLGSGTTGMVCQDLGRKWIGFELNEEYAPLIEQRTKQLGLFGQEAE